MLTEIMYFYESRDIVKVLYEISYFLWFKDLLVRDQSIFRNRPHKLGVLPNRLIDFIPQLVIK